MLSHRRRRFQLRLISILLATLALPAATPAHSADLARLTKLFVDNFYDVRSGNVVRKGFYEPRLCGQNIAKFVQAAQKNRIDLSGAEILKIVGAGFLETSGFYQRLHPNDRVFLGYFHVVLVANGHIFDFDLHKPYVLPFPEYVRLQFTPPTEPFAVPPRPAPWVSLNELRWWNATRYQLDGQTKISEHPLRDLVDLPKMMMLRRPQ